jgi:hypothetical protein
MADLPHSLQIALGYPTSYAEDWSVDGSRVEFVYARNPAPWPWTTLPSWHPVVVDKLQYFSAVTASWAAGAFAAETRTALTKLHWSSLRRESSPAARGVYESYSDERGIGYTLEIFDAEGRETLRTRGEGAAFGDRDFGAWRSAAKEKAVALRRPAPDEMADPTAAGLGQDGCSLVSPLRTTADAFAATGWVTASNAFPPHHPFHTGSGDHVNAGHLLDCAMQCAHLALEPSKPLYCSGGEAEFLRFIELGVPFEISLTSEPRSAGGTRIRTSMRQGDRDTTRITLDLEA